MPIYQYKCRNCGANIEKMQSFTSESLVECPECHQPALKKVMSAAGIIFKGSGWYITDSKKSSSAVAPSGESNKSDDSKSGTSKSEGSKSDNAKSGDSTPASGGESKSGESKSGDSKSGDSKSAESKPAVAAPAASGTSS